MAGRLRNNGTAATQPSAVRSTRVAEAPAVGLAAFHERIGVACGDALCDRE